MKAARAAQQRPVITADSWGTVYLLHFSQRLGNPANPRAMAQHYIGWASDLEGRLAEHRTGQGAAITRAAWERGITFQVVRFWQAPLGFEKLLKSRKEAPDLCPVCCASAGRRPRLVVVPTADQLTLDLATRWQDLDELEAPLPDVPAPRWPIWDWYQTWWQNTIRAVRQLQPTLADLPDDTWVGHDLPY